MIEGFELAVSYEVTGKDRNGNRFKCSTTNPTHALGINVWQGTVWAVMSDGSRKVVRRVHN